jgi:hypothetical protein
LASGYTDRLRNLDIDIVGATDSLARDVVFMIMLIVVVVIAVAVVVLLSVWIGGEYELSEDGDKSKKIKNDRTVNDSLCDTGPQCLCD